MTKRILAACKAWMIQRKVRAAKIDRNAKCPACGYRRGTITFAPVDKAIKHRCMECGATWGEDTLLPVEHWF